MPTNSRPTTEPTPLQNWYDIHGGPSDFQPGIRGTLNEIIVSQARMQKQLDEISEWLAACKTDKEKETAARSGFARGVSFQLVVQLANIIALVFFAAGGKVPW